MLNFHLYFCPITSCRCMSHRQKSSKSILSSKTLTASTVSASCEDSTIFTQQKWLRKCTDTNKGVHLSCQCYTFCPVCKDNKIVCCRYNKNPTASQFSFSSDICTLFTFYTPLDMIFCNPII